MGSGWGSTPWDDIPEGLQQPLYDLVTCPHPLPAITNRDILEATRKIAEYMDENHTCEATVHAGSRNPDSWNFGPDEGCEDIALPGSRFCAGHAEAGDFE